jgi:hypothetical protein
MNRQRQAAILETTGSSGNRNVPVPVHQEEIAVISVSAGDFDGPNNPTLTPAPTQEETIEEEETDKPSESVDVHLKKITLRNDLKACTSGKQMRFLLSNYASSTNDGFYWSLLRPLLTENKLLNSDKGRCCCRKCLWEYTCVFLNLATTWSVCRRSFFEDERHRERTVLRSDGLLGRAPVHQNPR